MLQITVFLRNRDFNYRNSPITNKCHSLSRRIGFILAEEVLFDQYNLLICCWVKFLN